MKPVILIFSILFLLSLVMIGLGLCIKQTNGLFWSRMPQDFLKDRHDPKFENERKIGKAFSKAVLTFFPALAIVFLILWLLSITGFF